VRTSRRLVLLAGVAGLGLSLLPSPGVEPLVAQSSDNSRYASIVVDAASGETLFGRYADERRFPASVTKVMTLYLTFEALQEGRIKLTDELVVSPRAASQPPSKLGLAAGQRISLDDAMRATAIRSANDMAMAIAEHVGGSEARFATLATDKARELGMSQTRYVNPHGLPDSRQVTSARDLTILSRAVMRDFPQYYHYFGQHDWTFRGRGYRSTNGLLSSGQGFDGIKTGYINASGYNLAASAVRDGRRIITVVMGGRSSASRNAHVAELMNTGFEVQRRRAQGEPIQLAQTFFEQRGFGIGSSGEANAPITYASIDGLEDQGAEMERESTGVAYTSLPARAVPVVREVAPAPASAPTPAPPVNVRAYAEAVAAAPPPVTRTAPRTEARRPISLTASLNGASGVVDRTPAARPATTPAPAAPAASGTWAVQVGAFREEGVARDWLTEVNRRFRSELSGAQQTVSSAAGWHRSRFTGLSQTGAEAACAALGERRVTCMVIRPD